VTVLIRCSQLADIAAIQHVARTTWHDTYKEIIPEQVQTNFLNIAYSEGNVKRRMERSRLYIAETEGGIAGFANFSFATMDNEAELHAIYVDPAYQGQGTGSKLLQYGLKDLQGISRLFINVEKENSIGQAFYFAKGFRKVGDAEQRFNNYTLRTIRMALILE
jgi:ribosomal protein S18 acetylase RimI-like enzyme